MMAVLERNRRTTEMVAGARATVPMIVGAIPFGLIFGTLAQPSGLSPLAAVAMSIVVFAGASQFIAIGLMAAGAALPLIIATTFVVNLRHMLYAANLVAKVRHLPQRWRAVMAFGLTDETFAAVSNRYLVQEDTTTAHWFYLGSWLAMYSSWVLCTLAGMMLGEWFPDMTNWGLDFAMSVTFIGIVAPYLRNAPMWAAVLVAVVLAVGLSHLPHNLGLLLAALGGMATGLSCQRLRGVSADD